MTGVTSTSAWTAYKRGDREFCGNEIPDGMRKNEKVPEPILTPSTKAAQGEHDESVPPSELYKRKILEPGLYKELARIAMRLYERGVSRAADHGLIFVDTKYEFGVYNDELIGSGSIIEINKRDNNCTWCFYIFRKLNCWIKIKKKMNTRLNR